MFDSYRKSFECFINCFSGNIFKIFSLGLKSGEREGMLNLIAPTATKACLTFLLFCTGHPSWRERLDFGILHRLKVS